MTKYLKCEKAFDWELTHDLTDSQGELTGHTVEIGGFASGRDEPATRHSPAEGIEIEPWRVLHEDKTCEYFTDWVERCGIGQAEVEAIEEAAHDQLTSRDCD